MKVNVKWTPQAEKGLDEVLEYLKHNWTQKEEDHLRLRINEFISRISQNPFLCPTSIKYPNLRKGRVDPYNYIIYRIQGKNGLIEIVNFRAYKQKPLN